MNSLEISTDSQPKGLHLISVITPLFNEEALLPNLAMRLKNVFASLPSVSWEWVAVDDGSRDRTFASATQEIKIAPEWQLLRLSRNFGQQAAYRAGLEAARQGAHRRWS